MWGRGKLTCALTLYAQGAAWDKAEQEMVNLSGGALTSQLPPVRATVVVRSAMELLKDVQASRDADRDAGSRLVASYKFVYNCPMYRTQQRHLGVDFVMDLPMSTSVPPEHWCLRGAAVLCQFSE